MAFFRVRSKSTGAHFGSYATRKSAEMDAEHANENEKFGLKDFEAEEKPEPEPEPKSMGSDWEVWDNGGGNWMAGNGEGTSQRGPFRTQQEAERVAKNKGETVEDANELPTVEEVDLALKTLTKAFAKGVKR